MEYYGWDFSEKFFLEDPQRLEYFRSYVYSNGRENFHMDSCYEFMADFMEYVNKSYDEIVKSYSTESYYIIPFTNTSHPHLADEGFVITRNEKVKLYL